jgi:hypothetical protein
MISFLKMAGIAIFLLFSLLPARAGRHIICQNKERPVSKVVPLPDLNNPTAKLEGRFFSFPLAPFQRSNETFLQYSNEFAIFSDTIYHLEYNDKLESIELHITAITQGKN